MLDQLREYVHQNQRVCPMPHRWDELWKILPNRRRVGTGWHPPQPLILGASSDTPALAKARLLLDQLEFAAEHGVLADVDRFLRSLQENEWAHLSDFRSESA